LEDTVNKPAFRGAPHSAEIPYALGNLDLIKVYQWTADDFKVSATMQAYFANFIKTGNPNGPGLPTWYGLQSSIPKVMVLDVNAHSEPEKNARRYAVLDQLFYP
jgi:para-nitrobenzyl esterase